MSEIVLTLPDELAQEAQEMGLFSPTLAASIFRSELKRRRAAKFYEAADRLADLGGESMSEDEIQSEVEAAREARRAK